MSESRPTSPSPTRTEEDVDPVDLHRRAADLFTSHVRAIRDDQWTDPTPCADWDVRDLVSHLVSEHLWMRELFAGRTVDEVGDRFEGNVAGVDPVMAWAEALAGGRAVIEEPGSLDRMIHLSFGDVPGRIYAMQLFSDLVVHSWDLARAIGADDTLPVELAGACLAFNEPYAALMRGSGRFGAPLEVPAGADVQTRLIAFFGRDPSPATEASGPVDAAG